MFAGSAANAWQVIAMLQMMERERDRSMGEHSAIRKESFKINKQPSASACNHVHLVTDELDHTGGSVSRYFFIV